MDLGFQFFNLLLNSLQIGTFQCYWYLKVQQGQQLCLSLDQIATPKFVVAPGQQIHEFGCSKLMDLSSDEDDSGGSESDLCLVDVYFEAVKDVQADKVGIY